MNEPSVLDCVKSIFKNRASLMAFLKAWWTQADPLSSVEVSSSPEEEAVPAPEPARPEQTSFPWRSLLLLIFALLGQRALEPPDRNAVLGVVFYLAALALAIWAFRRGELAPAPLPRPERQRDPWTVRRQPFFLSLILTIAAFFLLWDLRLFGQEVAWWPTEPNRFNVWNVSVWSLAVALFIGAFWLPVETSASLRARLAGQQEQRSRWAWAVVVPILAVILFFHLHRLPTVVPEMNSDHAEKLWDVFDVTRGQYSIFFPRNTGREPLYVYLAALIAQFSGISFLTLKIASLIGGLLTLPYLYLLGVEMGSRRIGLLAVMFAGIAYWPIVLERFSLRISFYPLFVAPTLYYLIRGLRRQSRNDFILAGLALGLGLLGYTPFRIMPLVVVALVVIYLLHQRDRWIRRQTLFWLLLLALTSFLVFLPLARYAIEEPFSFGFRALSRLGPIERPLPGPAWQIFLSNLWNALRQFNWDNGIIWVHSIPNRPALDLVSGALFLLGAFLLLARYLHRRQWQDLAILLAVPFIQMPSILSLAFPAENPSLNRTAGAIVPVFLLVGIGLDGLLSTLGSERRRVVLGWGLVGALFLLAALQNYALIFQRYNDQYRMNAWNTSELGAVMKDAMRRGVPAENIWAVGYPHWVDTRLPPIWAGVPGRDMAIWGDELANTLTIPGPKVFFVKYDDQATLTLLQTLYPAGEWEYYNSEFDHHDFWILRVP